MKKGFEGGEVGLKRPASDFEMTLTDVGFDLLFGHTLGRDVSETANAVEDGPDVDVVGAGHESGEAQVLDEALA